MCDVLHVARMLRRILHGGIWGRGAPILLIHNS